MTNEFDLDAIVASLDAEIEAAEERTEETRKRLEEEKGEVWRLRRTRRDLTGEPIQSGYSPGGRNQPRTGMGPNKDIYAPNPKIAEPILEFMRGNGGTTNQDLVDAGLAKNRQRATDYLLRMAKFGMLKKGKLRKNPNPSASKPFQEYRLP